MNAKLTLVVPSVLAISWNAVGCSADGAKSVGVDASADTSMTASDALADTNDVESPACAGDAANSSCCCDGDLQDTPVCGAQGTLSCKPGFGLYHGSDCSCTTENGPCCAAHATPGDAGDAGEAGCNDGLSDARATAPVCGTWTLGVGAACDECVGSHCSYPGDECCHRGSLCSNPAYEYRLALSHCIANNCAAPCAVACQGWPLSP